MVAIKHRNIFFGCAFRLTTFFIHNQTARHNSVGKATGEEAEFSHHTDGVVRSFHGH